MIIINKNWNNKTVVKYDDIDDYYGAARDFSEGNLELNELLLNCFSKNIKTVACCRGHKTGNTRPYISFLYTEDNFNLFYLLLSKLKEKGYSFMYSRVPNNKSGFSIYEKENCDLSSITLFKDIDDIIKNYDDKINYYYDLDDDLKEFMSIINLVEQDINLDYNSRYGLPHMFQLYYEKLNDKYLYSLQSTFSYYRLLAATLRFKSQSIQGRMPSLVISSYDRNILDSKLKGLKDKIRIYIEDIYSSPKEKVKIM